MQNPAITAHSPNYYFSLRVQQATYVSFAALGAIAAASSTLAILAAHGYPLGSLNTLPLMGALSISALYSIFTGGSLICALALYSLCQTDHSNGAKVIPLQVTEDEDTPPLLKLKDRRTETEDAIHKPFLRRSSSPPTPSKDLPVIKDPSPRNPLSFQSTEESVEDEKGNDFSSENSGTSSNSFEEDHQIVDDPSPNPMTFQDLQEGVEGIEDSASSFERSSPIMAACTPSTSSAHQEVKDEFLSLRLKIRKYGELCKIDRDEEFILIYCDNEENGAQTQVFQNEFERDLFLAQFEYTTDLSFIQYEISKEECVKLRIEINAAYDFAASHIKPETYLRFDFKDKTRYGIITEKLLGIYTNKKARDHFAKTLDLCDFSDATQPEIQNQISSLFPCQFPDDAAINKLADKITAKDCYCLIDTDKFILMYWDRESEQCEIVDYDFAEVRKHDLLNSDLKIDLSFIQYEVDIANLERDESYQLFKETMPLLPNDHYLSYNHPQEKWFGILYQTQKSQPNLQVYSNEEARDEHLKLLKDNGLKNWIITWTREPTNHEEVSIDLIPKGSPRLKSLKEFSLPNDLFVKKNERPGKLDFIAVHFKRNIEELIKFINEEGMYCKIDHYLGKYTLIYFDKVKNDSNMIHFNKTVERETFIKCQNLSLDLSCCQYLINSNQRNEIDKLGLYEICVGAISSCDENDYLCFNFPKQNCYGIILSDARYIFTEEKWRDAYLSVLRELGYEDGAIKWSRVPYSPSEVNLIIIPKSGSFPKNFQYQSPPPNTFYYKQIKDKGWILAISKSGRKEKHNIFLTPEFYFEGFKTKDLLEKRKAILVGLTYKDGHQPFNELRCENLSYEHRMKFMECVTESENVYGIFPYSTRDPSKSFATLAIKDHDFNSIRFLYFPHFEGCKGYLHEYFPHHNPFNQDHFIKDCLDSDYQPIYETDAAKYKKITKKIRNNFKQFIGKQKKVYGILSFFDKKDPKEFFCILAFQQEDSKSPDFLYFKNFDQSKNFIHKFYPRFKTINYANFFNPEKDKGKKTVPMV